MEKPFIYLAFANQETTGEHLPALNLEIQGLRDIFFPFKVSDEIQQDVNTMCSIDSLARDLIKIKQTNAPKFIHFSGHADTKFWYLTDGLRFTDDRLNDLFFGMKNIKLVFMNACCTKPLKDLFLNKLGVEAVIATSETVDDIKAKSFAMRFYESLIQPQTDIERAFREARSAVTSVGPIDDSDRQNRGLLLPSRKVKDDFEWGLYWKDEKSAKIVFNQGFANIMPPEKKQFWDDYKSKTEEFQKKSKDAVEGLKQIDTTFELVAASITDLNTRKMIADSFEKNKEPILKPLKELEEEIENLRLKLANISLPTYVQSRLDEFNFDKQMLGLFENCQDTRQKFRTGAYILRGTKECGLGFLIKKIASSFMLTDDDTLFKDNDKKPRVVDCGALSFEREDLIKHLQVKFNLQKELVTTSADLARAFVKNHFKLPYSTPYILIFDNLQIEEQRDVVELLIGDFWVALHKSLRQAQVSRPVLFLLIERRPIKIAASTHSGDFDMSFNTDDFMPQDADFLSTDGLVHFAEDVEKDVISVDKLKNWCVSRGFLFSAWVKNANQFLDPERPRVQPTMMRMIEKIIPKTDDSSNNGFTQTQQYILDQDQLTFCRTW